MRSSVRPSTTDLPSVLGLLDNNSSGFRVSVNTGRLESGRVGGIVGLVRSPLTSMLFEYRFMENISNVIRASLINQNLKDVWCLHAVKVPLIVAASPVLACLEYCLVSFY